MPITHRASKKLRHDRKKTKKNASQLRKLRTAIKAVRVHATAKSYNTAVKTLDKAAKSNLIHKNKAARLKSRLSKLLKK